MDYLSHFNLIRKINMYKRKLKSIKHNNFSFFILDFLLEIQLLIYDDKYEILNGKEEIT